MSDMVPRSRYDACNADWLEEKRLRLKAEMTLDEAIRLIPPEVTTKALCEAAKRVNERLAAVEAAVPYAGQRYRAGIEKAIALASEINDQAEVGDAIDMLIRSLRNEVEQPTPETPPQTGTFRTCSICGDVHEPGESHSGTEPPPEIGVSDALKEMEARKDAAYEERNRVVAALAWMAVWAGWKAGIARTAIEGWSEDWHGCVYIDLPSGQVSWHYHDSHAYLFAGLSPYVGAWDGHDTPEKYRRVGVVAEVLSTGPRPCLGKEPIYHASLEEGRWYVAAPSGQTIVAGPFPSEAEATEYASAINAGRLAKAPPRQGDGRCPECNQEWAAHFRTLVCPPANIPTGGG